MVEESSIRALLSSVDQLLRQSDRPAVAVSQGFAEKVAKAFWGDDCRKAWVEPPYTAQGVHHYRLFCDPAWSPILPHGEVYDRSETPPGWKMFSETHGYTPAPEDAPWLTAASQ